MVTSIIVGAFMTGLLSGAALTYMIVKSYKAAMVCAIGALLNFGILIFAVLRLP